MWGLFYKCILNLDKSLKLSQTSACTKNPLILSCDFSIGEVTWEIAVPKDTQDRLALEVEQCDCPPGYIGTSCEDCAEGYERSGHGPYLGTCVPKRAPQIQCHGVGAVSPSADYGGRCVCRVGYTGERCEVGGLWG